MRNRVGGFGLFIVLCWLILGPVGVRPVARAQGDIQATVGRPSTENFPRIEASLDVRDAQGLFRRGLQASQVRVVENGVSLAVDELSEQRQGVQFVTVINPGPSFATRDSSGISRYELLIEALTSWAKIRRGSNLDDLSLLTTNSLEIGHVADPQEWADVLNRELVDARQATPNLDALYRGLDYASDTPPRPGMGRALLFITPPLEGELLNALANVAPLAKEHRVRLFVWMVANAGGYPARSADQLNNLAVQTGGLFFVYTGQEAIPNLEEYLDQLRSVYQLSYTSQVNTSGTHELAVELQTGETQLTTLPVTFDLNLLPPDPAFLNPPMEIVRQAPDLSDEDISSAEAANLPLLPTEHTIQVLVSFPDERLRPLRRTTLLVDGSPVAQNLQAPFDQFTWNLEGFTESGEHLLKVEAEDSLGLIGSSIELAVMVKIDRPASQSFLPTFSGRIPILAALVIVMAGSVLGLVLVLGGRLHPYPRGSRLQKNDPVTQPVAVQNDQAAPRRLPGWVNRLQWPQRHTAPKAYAFLSRIAENEQDMSAAPLPLTSDEITLGSDPNQAILVLNDPSVEGLHARLVRREDGTFRLADEGSIAGTWINYTPVSREGAALEHGDLVHIGRVGFRFTLRQPSQVRRPVVTLEGAIQDPLDASLTPPVEDHQP